MTNHTRNSRADALCSLAAQIVLRRMAGEAGVDDFENVINRSDDPDYGSAEEKRWRNSLASRLAGHDGSAIHDFDYHTADHVEVMARWEIWDLAFNLIGFYPAAYAHKTHADWTSKRLWLALSVVAPFSDNGVLPNGDWAARLWLCVSAMCAQSDEATADAVALCRMLYELSELEDYREFTRRALAWTQDVLLEVSRAGSSAGFTAKPVDKFIQELDQIRDPSGEDHWRTAARAFDTALRSGR